MKYIKPETILIEVELSNLVMGSPIEYGKADPTKPLGSVDGDNIVMSKHDSFEFDDSDDSFNDSWD